jgi:hypothetical protein
MFSTSNMLRLTGAFTLLAFFAGSAVALPGIPKGGGGNHNKHNTKATDPLDSAIKDLQEAEKSLGTKEWSNASQKTRSAEQIVSAQDTSAKQARDKMIENGAPKEQRDHIKARVTALDGVIKDIHTAEKNISAKKVDDAVTAIKAAISGLEGLTGGGEKKKK